MLVYTVITDAYAVTVDTEVVVGPTVTGDVTVLMAVEGVQVVLW